jgi:hypothetical protein
MFSKGNSKQELSELFKMGEIIMNEKIIKGTQQDQSYMLNYKEEEKDDNLIITAKLIIHKNSHKAQQLIEKASQKETSPLTMVLEDNESQRRRDKRHDE